MKIQVNEKSQSEKRLKTLKGIFEIIIRIHKILDSHYLVEKFIMNPYIVQIEEVVKILDEQVYTWRYDN